MLTTLSMLWPLFALATDREEDKVSVRLLIATWLALEDYDSIIRYLGLGPDPLWQWNKDSDPSYQFIMTYAQELRTGPIGPNYLSGRTLPFGTSWMDDFPVLKGLVSAYNAEVSGINNKIHEINKKKTVPCYGGGPDHLEGKQQGLYRRSMYGGEDYLLVFAPGWDNGWPVLPEHEDRWYLQVKARRKYYEKMEINISKLEPWVRKKKPEELRQAPKPSWIRYRKWSPIVTFEFHGKLNGTQAALTGGQGLTWEQSFNHAVRNYCAKNNLIQLYPATNSDSFISVERNLTTTEKHILDEVIPQLGKISDNSLSITANISLYMVKKLRELNGIPPYRKPRP
jgi:hypothetical protein